MARKVIYFNERTNCIIDIKQRELDMDNLEKWLLFNVSNKKF